MKKSIILLLAISACGLLGAAEAAAPAKAAPAAPAVAAAPAKAAPAAPAAPAKAAPAAAAPAAAVQQPAAPQKEEDPCFALCIARGFCNVSTGWLELPRCIIYDNDFIPVFGLIAGIPEGAILTVCRTLSGVVDIISFGAIGNTFHGKVFPNTIFESKWKVEKK